MVADFNMNYLPKINEHNLDFSHSLISTEKYNGLTSKDRLKPMKLWDALSCYFLVSLFRYQNAVSRVKVAWASRPSATTITQRSIFHRMNHCIRENLVLVWWVTPSLGVSGGKVGSSFVPSYFPEHKKAQLSRFPGAFLTTWPPSLPLALPKATGSSVLPSSHPPC